MTWNHRIVKKTLDDGTELFGIHEVFYNPDGTIHAYTEDPVEVVCESVEGLQDTLKWMTDSLSEEILIDGEVEFVDMTKEEKQELIDNLAEDLKQVMDDAPQEEVKDG